MNLKYVVAIIRPDVLAALETELGRLHVRGLTVTKVAGFGEYADFFATNHLTEHLKVEIFSQASEAEAIVSAIRAIARSDVPGAGIVAVMPVEQFFHLHTPPEGPP